MNDREQSNRTLVVGTAPPTRCGLATYTMNVQQALGANGVDARILRLLNHAEPSRPAPDGVAAVWRDGEPDGAIHAAEVANEFDRVLIQHEYGIYPGEEGSSIVEFLGHLERPPVTVLHTVLEEPNRLQRQVLDALVATSSSIVVHGTTAQTRLLDSVAIDPSRVVVIPHGATIRKRHSAGFEETRPLMLSWGLIGPGKGLEHGIAAVAQLRDMGIEVEYLIAGATHPNVRIHSGEQYRRSLQQLADRLGVADLVHFDDRYCTWREQQEWIDAASFVLLPYDNADQVTSGVLVEAMAAGKPVIATAFAHARELEPTGALIVVDQGSSAQIAAAMHALATDLELRGRMETAARIEGMRCDWGVVGHRYAELLQASEQFVTAGGPR
ncbi:MAG: glycosyltransferase [Actinobacteria bacterium]|nr:glycosyltransferase [Actinomycetota bacterium]